MTMPILATKLYIPSPPPNLVPRPRLIERLNAGLHGRLTLVSAPAGYGKTTLVAEWIHQFQDVPDAHVGWLSLAEDDSDPFRFFSYLSATIRPVPGVGSTLSNLLHSGQATPAKNLMAAFIHDVASAARHFYLVLDDYHAIVSGTVEEATSFLIKHMPSQMNLLLVSRTDPGFPISRLRARDDLVEVRADDLRFTEAEAGEFLRRRMGVILTPDQITALEARTEGWIAGLQMAALSMRNRTDVDNFVASFAGSHRFVMDYLMEEVLSQQPKDVRDFLLATSILEQLTGSLCDAVRFAATEAPDASAAAATVHTGKDGRAILAALERDNLFVVSLDDERRWYRYHHLFADVLRTYAQANRMGQVAGWHKRAGEWFAQHGMLSDAIRHALAAENFTQAADLLEAIRFTMEGPYQIGTWLNWVQSLPEEIVGVRPVLQAAYGWALIETGKLTAGKALVQEAQKWLDAPDDDCVPEQASRKVVGDQDQWQTLPASVAVAHAYCALAQGDVPAAIEQAQQALDFSPNEDHQWRRAALALLGITRWINGDLHAAAQAFATLTQNSIEAGRLVDAIGTAHFWAEMQFAAGQLDQVAQTTERLLRLATKAGGPLPVGTSDLHRMRAVLAWVRGDKDTAFQQLAHAARLGEQAGMTNWAYRLALTQAFFAREQADFDAALGYLAEAKRVYYEDPMPVVRPLAAQRARVWLAQGNLAQAAAWAATAGVSTDEPVSYLREFEHLTLARLRLAQFQQNRDTCTLDEAMRLLHRLQETAVAQRRTGSVLEILILRALVHAAQRDMDSALQPLMRALAIAEPQGYVSFFVSEGRPMATLLKAVAEGGTATAAYAARLVSAMDDSFPGAAVSQSLIEPLSDRELEILALIAAGQKNKEIAEELVISLNTVLYHTKNIYGKLGVNKRMLAVRRAQEIGLL